MHVLLLFLFFGIVAADMSEHILGVCSTPPHCTAMKEALNDYVLVSGQQGGSVTFNLVFATSPTDDFFSLANEIFASDTQVALLIADPSSVDLVFSVARLAEVPLYYFSPGFDSLRDPAASLAKEVQQNSLFRGGLLLRHSDVGIPLGGLAAAQSESGRLGVILGSPTRVAKELLEGITAGIHHECPACSISVRYIEPQVEVSNAPGSRGVPLVSLNVTAVTDAIVRFFSDADVILIQAFHEVEVRGIAQWLAAHASSSGASSPLLVCATCREADHIIRYSVRGFLSQKNGIIQHGGLAARFLDIDLVCVLPSCLGPRSTRVFADLHLRIISGLTDPQTLTAAAQINAARLRLGSPAAAVRADLFGFVPIEGIGDITLDSNARFLCNRSSSSCPLQGGADVGSVHDCMIVAAHSPSSRGLSPVDHFVLDCHNLLFITPPDLVHEPAGASRTARDGFSLTAISRDSFAFFGGFSDSARLVPIAELAVMVFPAVFASSVTLFHLHFDDFTAMLLPPARGHHAAASHGSRLFVHGGTGSGGRLLADLWVADIVITASPRSVSASWQLLHDSLLESRLHSMAAFNAPPLASGLAVIVLIGGLVINQPHTSVVTFVEGGAQGAPLVSSWAGQNRPDLPLSPCFIPMDNETVLSVGSNGVPCLLNLALGTWSCRHLMDSSAQITPSSMGYRCAKITSESRNAVLLGGLLPTESSSEQRPVMSEFIVYAELHSECADPEVALELNSAMSPDRLTCISCSAGFYTALTHCERCGGFPSELLHKNLLESTLLLNDTAQRALERYCGSEEESSSMPLSPAIIGLLSASAFIAGLSLILVVWLLRYRSLDDQNPHNAPQITPLGIMFISIADAHVHWRNSSADFHDVVSQWNALLSESIARHRGYNVKVVGESVMVVSATVEQLLKIASHLLLRMGRITWRSSLGHRIELRIGIDYNSPSIVNSELGVDYTGPQSLVAALLLKAIPPNNIAITDAALVAAGTHTKLPRIAQRQPECRGHSFYLVNISEFREPDALNGTASSSSSSSSPSTREGKASSSVETASNRHSAVDMDGSRVEREMERVAYLVDHENNEQQLITLLDEQARRDGAVRHEELQLLRFLTIDVLRSTLTALKTDQGHYTELLLRRFAVNSANRDRRAGRRGHATSLADLNMLAGRVLQTIDLERLRHSVRSAYEVGLTLQTHSEASLSTGSAQSDPTAEQPVATPVTVDAELLHNPM